jgi:hypothetical protein
MRPHSGVCGTDPGQMTGELPDFLGGQLPILRACARYRSSCICRGGNGWRSASAS